MITFLRTFLFTSLFVFSASTVVAECNCKKKMNSHGAPVEEQEMAVEDSDDDLDGLEKLIDRA